MQLRELFHRNIGSLKMYDETIELFNQYITTSDFNKYARLVVSWNTFLTRVGEVFITTDLKPTYGSVRIHNGSLVIVPVFDIKAMIMSILHDTVLMQPDNFVELLNIFTGNLNVQ